MENSKIKNAITKSPALQIVFFILTVAYVVLPVDFVPDVVPLVGWLDDMAAVFAELINLLLFFKHAREQSRAQKTVDNA